MTSPRKKYAVGVVNNPERNNQMTGHVESNKYREYGEWLLEVLDAEFAPSEKGLREVAQKLIEAADRIEELCMNQTPKETPKCG